VIVLDTHAWVWWVSDPDELSRRARKAIEEAAVQDAVFISSISVLEVALLVTRKRLDLSMDLEDWIRRAEAIPHCSFVPVDNGIALQAIILRDYGHPDPIDRVIMATAMSLGKSLVTKDRRIRSYRPINTVW
jgi:PIN domain nuclease of toxin-antitoxin system